MIEKDQWFGKDYVNCMKETLNWSYNTLGNISVDLVESFLFNEKILNSCFGKTARETYE